MQTQAELAIPGLTTRPIHPTFGLEISGLDVSKPLDDKTIAWLKDASSRFKLLLFKEQNLSTADLSTFAGKFGDTAQDPPKTSAKLTRSDNITQLGTKGDEAGPISAYDIVARFWHSDSSWRPIPTWLTFLTAVVMPEDEGNTAFADMEAAYNALSDDRKALLESKQMVHAFTTMRRYDNSIPEMSEDDAPPPAAHPLVRTVDGRRALFMSSQTCYYVGNMPFEEGRALYGELMAHATSAPFVYQHKWVPGDLAVWDNRTTMHRAVPYEWRKKRLMHRAEVKGTEVPR